MRHPSRAALFDLLAFTACTMAHALPFIGYGEHCPSPLQISDPQHWESSLQVIRACRQACAWLSYFNQ